MITEILVGYLLFGKGKGMSDNYLIGTDILGESFDILGATAYSGSGTSASGGNVYTDKATVEIVQRELSRPSSQVSWKTTPGLKVDGVIGPKTKAALLEFNSSRGVPQDGDRITDGVLHALGLPPLEVASMESVSPVADVRPATSSSTSTSSAPPRPGVTPGGSVAAEAMPTWKKVLIGGMVVTSVAAVGGGLFMAFRKGHG